jgi:hypothetical protein
MAIKKRVKKYDGVFVHLSMSATATPFRASKKEFDQFCMGSAFILRI